MLRAEFEEIVRNGENSGVEFKRDDIRPEVLAREIVAFANLMGGRIFLGVEDNGSVSGLRHDHVQEWVLNIFRDKVHPMIVPFYEELHLDEGHSVGVITVPMGTSKPYVVKNNGRDEYYIRMGDRTETASREQLMRLFQARGMLHTEIMPVHGTSLSSLDLDRIGYYLKNLLSDDTLPESEDAWIERLCGLGLMSLESVHPVCTIAGIVCFGKNPRRDVPSAGIRFMVFDDEEKNYRARYDTLINAPMVARWERSETGLKSLIDEGLIEKIIRTIEPFNRMESDSIDENFRRESQYLYPFEALREAILNALIHRDWTESTDIEICMYSDRMEITSPGRLRNSMTVEKMLAGQRSPRNTLLVDIMRDYGYVDGRGMGVRIKIVPLMRQLNGRDPVFEATDDYVRVILKRR